MLLFFTILDIHPTLTADGLNQLSVEWNQESLQKDNIIPGAEWKGKYTMLIIHRAKLSCKKNVGGSDR